MDRATIQESIDLLSAAPLPAMIVVDVTNACNIACVHCPQADIQARPGFKARHLPFSHFERIVAEIAEAARPCLLRIVGDGEPFVHPQLTQMVSLAKKHCQAKVNLTTNGILMTPKRIDALLEAQIDLIDVSIDALTLPTYEKIRRGGDFVRLMANLFHLLRQRQGTATRVMTSFIEQAENAAEAEGFRTFWEPLVDFVMIRSLHSAVGLVKTEESTSRNRAHSVERFPCPHLWKRLTIDFTGAIKFCAHDWRLEEEMVLGNIAEHSLADVWQGKKLTELRHRHEVGDYTGGNVCSRCTDWASSRWDYGYERLIDRLLYGTPTLLPTLPPLETT